MTKAGNQNKQLKDAVALGRKNKELIPRVRNWCSHLKIEDVSGGMVAEMYNLPITLRISCPHASGSFEAMNFEWIATDFINDHCHSCKFHKEVFKSNFGRDVINNYEKRKEESEKIEKEETEKKQALKEQVETLFIKEKSQSEVTELSILNLIQSLEKYKDKKKIAMQILEASKLSPIFFSTIALDFLCLYYDDKDIGKEIIQTTENILKSGKSLSTFGFERLNVIIGKKQYIDQAASILNLHMKKNEIIIYIPVIKQILESLSYERNVGDSYDDRPSYPNLISLLINVYDIAPNLLFKLLDEQLKIDIKTDRINTNYLLQELIKANRDTVIPHCTAIIKSLEFEDDGYGESADGVTCSTLCKLYNSAPELTTELIYKLYPKLSEGAKVELSRFYKIILLEDDFALKFPKHTNNIVEKLFHIILAKETKIDLREKILSIVENTSRKKPELISNYFDILVGFLVDQIKAQETFNWYLKELNNPKDEVSTFNPLQARSYVEVDLERMKIGRTINEIESIIQNLISKEVPSDGYNKILDIIFNLKSSSDGSLKSKLIEVIRKSVKEPICLAELLPAIHGFLLDIDSNDVRYEAINFVNYIMNEHDQLITQTLIDLIKVFLSDTDIGVKGKAIDTYGTLIRKFPNQIEQEQIQIILDALTNPYVFIHKRAARLSYKIFPFLNETQKTVLIGGIMSHEDLYYKKKDFEYCKELIDILLFLTKEKAEVYSQIVHSYFAKYCDSKDYYTDVDFIEKLTFIRKQNDGFDSVWLQQTLGFLSRTAPAYYNSSSDNRNDLFLTIYEMSQMVIVDNLESIKGLITKKIHALHFSDVFELFSILGYFKLYEPLQELSNYFGKAIEKNKSNEYATEMNETYLRIANLEFKVSNQQIDKKFIKSLLNK